VRIVKIISINAILLFSLLMVVEWTLWQIYPDYNYYYRTHFAQADLEEILAKTDTTWLALDTDLGWVCQQKTSLLFPSPPVQGTCYQINQEGFRNSFDFSELGPKKRKRILLLGDSFTFGIYLPEHQTIAARLQHELGPDYLVVSMSIPAWGLDQMYLAHQKYIEQIDPDQILISFVDDDLMRSLEILFHGCGLKPCYKLEQNQLIENTDNPQWWEYSCWNNQIGNRILLGYYQGKAARLAKYFLEEIMTSAQVNNRTVTIARIPALIDLEAAVPRTVFSMAELCEQYHVDYLELYPELIKQPKEYFRKYYIPEDGHFSKEGTAFFTAKVLPLIQKKSDLPDTFER
jgi:hypothetical protein